jgi:uncharacterized protein YacL
MFGLIFEIIIVLMATFLGYLYHPENSNEFLYAAISFLVSLAIIYFIRKIEKSEFAKFWGGLIGFFLGIIIGLLLDKIISPFNIKWLEMIIRVTLPLIGVGFGIKKNDWFKFSTLKRSLMESKSSSSIKIMDTSAIIDGRIADLCETGFLEGKIIVPSFVVNELQQVADSSDPIKRQRGRRGFDFLQQLKKCPNIDFIVTEKSYPDIKEVDLKLLQMAKEIGGKIITTDYNLNKLAKIQEIKILNINELANSLKPVVLPGERINVYILKEGKEKDQGVAYLEDGTMVVVDNARKMIGQTVEITVTSVLQTVAGKMIFGRYE